MQEQVKSELLISFVASCCSLAVDVDFMATPSIEGTVLNVTRRWNKVKKQQLKPQNQVSARVGTVSSVCMVAKCSYCRIKQFIYPVQYEEENTTDC